MVGLAGFEPAASSSRTKRSTKLSHSPSLKGRHSRSRGRGGQAKGSAHLATLLRIGTDRDRTGPNAFRRGDQAGGLPTAFASRPPPERAAPVS